jgi:hypothetical protein
MPADGIAKLFVGGKLLVEQEGLNGMLFGGLPSAMLDDLERAD